MRSSSRSVVGDKVALVVQLPVPMYLYAVNIAPDGGEQLLNGAHGEGPVEGMVRLPESGFYNLVEPAGPELLALVATRQPIARSDEGRRGLLALVRHTDARNDLAKLQSADPPGIVNGRHASMGIRAETLALAPGGGVRTRWDGGDVVVLFDIDHRSE